MGVMRAARARAGGERGRTTSTRYTTSRRDDERARYAPFRGVKYASISFRNTDRSCSFTVDADAAAPPAFPPPAWSTLRSRSSSRRSFSSAVFARPLAGSSPAAVAVGAIAPDALDGKEI